jgi:hypothetical protein
VAVILDAGALIAIERHQREIGAILRSAQHHHLDVITSAGVLAQVWRGNARQANLARVIAGITVVDVDQAWARRIGQLLGKAKTSDVVDAHVALLANDGDAVLTSDARDIRHLLAVRRVDAAIHEY